MPVEKGGKAASDGKEFTRCNGEEEDIDKLQDDKGLTCRKSEALAMPLKRATMRAETKIIFAAQLPAMSLETKWLVTEVELICA